MRCWRLDRCPSTTSAPSSAPAAWSSPSPPMKPCARPIRLPSPRSPPGPTTPSTGSRRRSWPSSDRATPVWVAIPACRCADWANRDPPPSSAQTVRLSPGGQSRHRWHRRTPARRLAFLHGGPHRELPYRRLVPGNWAPRTATWGVGTYSTALRVVLDDPCTARLELRIPGADVSPHQCLAMLLGAVAWGVEHDLVEPPPPWQRRHRASTGAVRRARLRCHATSSKPPNGSRRVRRPLTCTAHGSSNTSSGAGGWPRPRPASASSPTMSGPAICSHV